MDESGYPALLDLLAEGPCATVTVTGVRGSAPRALGARMLVTAQAQRGSIGGGALEWAALARARELLAGGPAAQRELFGLGPALEQCCGGAVELLFQRFEPPAPRWLARAGAHGGESAACLVTRLDDEDAPRRWLLPDADSSALPRAVREHAATDEFQAAQCAQRLSTEDGEFLLEPLRPPCRELYLFGAGHVGKALVRALADLPFRVRWIDGRADEFPQELPANAERIVSDDPAALAAAAPAAAALLVMTHSHRLDEDICRAALARERCAWVGLIGSATKRKRFVHRLARAGIGPERLQRLVCPVGLAGLRGKRPATIAVAIAAQLLSEQVPEAWR